MRVWVCVCVGGGLSSGFRAKLRREARSEAGVWGGEVVFVIIFISINVVVWAYLLGAWGGA